MSLAFDTSLLIAIEKGDKRILKELEKISKVYPTIPQVPFISRFEYIFGVKKRKPKQSDNLLKFINKFPLLRTTEKTADILANLKLKYDNLGICLSLTDLLIASQVLENNLTLLTLDKDFKKIDEINSIVW